MVRVSLSIFVLTDLGGNTVTRDKNEVAKPLHNSQVEPTNEYNDYRNYK